MTHLPVTQQEYTVVLRIASEVSRANHAKHVANQLNGGGNVEDARVVLDVADMAQLLDLLERAISRE